MALYVRTGNAGSDPDYLIDDLGCVILSGSSWTELTSSTDQSPHGGSGQFTDIELKNSIDLYDAINNEDLEWSLDGSNQENGTFDSNIALAIDINDNIDITDVGLHGATQPGEMLYSQDGISFKRQIPLTCNAGWVLSDDGIFLIL